MNFLRIVCFLVLSYFLFLGEAFAKSESDARIWYGFSSKAEFSKSLSWLAQAQLRYNLNDSTMDQNLVRTGLLYSFSNQTLGLLYGFTQAGESKEHRGILQHSLKYSGFLKGFDQRFRYEYRDFEGEKSSSSRLRFRFKYQHSDFIKNYNLIVSDEVFFETESNEDNYGLFSRNRFYIGLRKKS